MTEAVDSAARELFDTGEGIYLLNHSVGRPPRSASAALQSGFLDAWRAPGEKAWSLWLEQIDGFRMALKDLLGGQVEGFCPQANLSSALGKILLSRPVDPMRPVILCCEHDFPSMIYVLDRMQRFGYRTRIIRGHGDALLDPDTWAGQLAPDVGVLLLGHVHSNSGRRMPVGDITALCRERGVLSVIDIAQSVGCIPIDLRRWQADFVIGSCVKWLCGGPGAGFLWGEEQALRDSEPVDVGWFSHEAPFEFDIDHFRYAPDALRFWGGTPSVVPFVTAANSIRTITGIGVENIHSHNIALVDLLAGALQAGERVSPARPEHRGGTLVLRLAPSREEDVARRLANCAVAFDRRSTGWRMSPHIYNSPAEMETVAACLGP